MGESDKIIANVHNNTDWAMRLTGSNLEWGKFVTSPIDVAAHSVGNFYAEGRQDSPSGTMGWATWMLEGNNGIVVRVDFDNPYSGSDSVSIATTPVGAVPTSVTQTGGDSDYVDYYIG
jgi:hypothetical protein